MNTSNWLLVAFGLALLLTSLAGLAFKFPDQARAARDKLGDVSRAWPMLLIFAITFAVVVFLNPTKAGLALWGVSKIALCGYLGYWADRLCFRPEDRPHLLEGISKGTAWKRRALILAAAILAGGMIPVMRALVKFLALVAVLCALVTISCVMQPAQAAARAAVRIPEVSTLYRLKIEREAARNFGIQAPAARMAAQIHQESAWRPKAESAFAQGLAQFTPATARWLPSVCPGVGPPDPWDPDWSLRAQACYMATLYDNIVPYRYAGPMTPCTRWNFALRGYNGGPGWLNKERIATQRAGGDANAWDQVERHRVRAGWAHKENIGYPRRILLTLEPVYLRAGWPGTAVCT